METRNRIPRGSVVVASDPFGNTPRRPYLIVSDESHPFAGEQYIAIGISTTEYDESIPLVGAFIEGRLDRASFVAPWAVVSIRAETIDRPVARIATAVTNEAVSRMASVAGLSGRAAD